MDAIFGHNITAQPSQSTFYKHSHQDYEMFFFLKGDAEYNIEGTVYQLAPCSLLIIKPSDYHFINILSPESYERIIINFLPSDSATTERLKGLEHYYYAAENSTVSRALLSLKDKKRTFSPSDFKEYLHHTLSQVVMELSYYRPLSPVEPASHNNETVTKIINYVTRNLSSRLTLDDIASSLYISKSTACHAFKRFMKTSLIKYIRHKKILYADELIRNGAKPSQAAELAGFSDYTTFFRAYKLVLHTSPSSRSSDTFKNT